MGSGVSKPLKGMRPEFIITEDAKRSHNTIKKTCYCRAIYKHKISCS